MTRPLPLKLILSQKRYRLLLFIVFFPFISFGQSLTGLWTGSLSNDSNTIRKDQSFEIALTEYRGKVYGYSCSEFIVNDTLFYIVKRVKGTINGDSCEVTDDEIIAYNFRGKLDKGVKVTSTFIRNSDDSTWHLQGTWKTNATKKYFAVTGKVGLKEEKDMAMSKLFPHLEELNLTKDIAFYQEQKQNSSPVVKVAKPEKILSASRENNSTIALTEVKLTPNQPMVQKAEADVSLASVNKRGESLTREDPKSINTTKVELNPAEVNKKITEADPAFASINSHDESLRTSGTKTISATPTDIVPTVVNKTQAEAQGTVSINKQQEIKQDKIPIRNQPVATTSINGNIKNTPVAVAQKTTTVAKTDLQQVKQQNVASTKPVTNAVVIEKPKTDPAPVILPPVQRPIEEVTKAAAFIDGRSSIFSEVVNFTSDSLELSLYDNGEIDGDTVSVYMNGEVLMSKQGLRSKAIKKTIYINKSNEDFTIVLFAENLGKYPPNTGLLVVHDGEDVYNLHFSSDLQKSTGIVFRKKAR
jgi:hypothetical protein